MLYASISFGCPKSSRRRTGKTVQRTWQASVQNTRSYKTIVPVTRFCAGLDISSLVWSGARRHQMEPQIAVYFMAKLATHIICIARAPMGRNHRPVASRILTPAIEKGDSASSNYIDTNTVASPACTIAPNSAHCTSADVSNRSHRGRFIADGGSLCTKVSLDHSFRILVLSNRISAKFFSGTHLRNVISSKLISQARIDTEEPFTAEGGLVILQQSRGWEMAQRLGCSVHRSHQNVRGEMAQDLRCTQLTPRY